MLIEVHLEYYENKEKKMHVKSSPEISKNNGEKISIES